MIRRALEARTRGSPEDFRARVSLAGEAADAAWRAWHYPVGNRSARARGDPTTDLARVPPPEREQRAEAAWDEVMRRDLRRGA